PIAGQRLRHRLVLRPQRGALGVERRIVLIGLDQRPWKRVGDGRRGSNDGCAGGNRHRRERPPTCAPRTCHALTLTPAREPPPPPRSHALTPPPPPDPPPAGRPPPPESPPHTRALRALKPPPASPALKTL